MAFLAVDVRSDHPRGFVLCLPFALGAATESATRIPFLPTESTRLPNRFEAADRQENFEDAEFLTAARKFS
jgi:hypothetical protein